MIDWSQVQKVLLVRLRSIGDTVLTTPSIISLRNFLPDAQIDILLEDWVAPVLSGLPEIDEVITTSKKHGARLRTARDIRRRRYDVAVNMHGGSTSSFFVRASGARERIGYGNYRFPFMYNHRFSSPADFWNRPRTHSAETQMALLGFAGVPVSAETKTRLEVSAEALASARRKLDTALSAAGYRNSDGSDFALIHPAAAFPTKTWAPENFAYVANHLTDLGLTPVTVVTPAERVVTDRIEESARVAKLDNLSLPEITALCSECNLFIGNDSGIAHIAAAVEAPSVVVFGSSNRDHWHPWTDAPYEVVFKPFECQPCPGYTCETYGEPRCILEVPAEDVLAAVDRLMV